MPLSSKLDRKLRAAEESSDGEDYYEVTDRSSSESVIETGAGGDIVSSDDDEDGPEDAEMVSQREDLHPVSPSSRAEVRRFR
jgi:ribosomal RNA-processing protein 36